MPYPGKVGGGVCQCLQQAWIKLTRRRFGDDVQGGIVLEGPVTNVWWRTGRNLFTPGLELGILAGLTRATLVEAAGELGYAVHEGRYSVDELAAAEEAFTSSSIREVMPAVELDGEPVGDGRPGPAAAELQAALRGAAAA